jgi:hypothetical protein
MQTMPGCSTQRTVSRFFEELTRYEEFASVSKKYVTNYVGKELQMFQERNYLINRENNGANQTIGCNSHRY